MERGMFRIMSMEDHEWEIPFILVGHWRLVGAEREHRPGTQKWELGFRILAEQVPTNAALRYRFTCLPSPTLRDISFG
jgi:hypothetical protein